MVYKVRWFYLPAIRGRLGHERILQSRGEASSSSASEAGLLNLIDNPVWSHLDDFLGLVPVPAFESAFNKGVPIFVQVGVDAILVFEVAVASESLLGGNKLRRHKRAIPSYSKELGAHLRLSEHGLHHFVFIIINLKLQSAC